MDILIPFLKSSSVVDLVILLFVILSAVILTIGGLVTVIASHSRKPIYFFMLVVLFPLLLALVGTYLRLRNIERLVAMNPGAGTEVVVAARQESWITTYIGAAGTTPAFLIGVAGLVLKKDRRP